MFILSFLKQIMIILQQRNNNNKQQNDAQYRFSIQSIINSVQKQMIEDIILHNMIRINQLIEQREQIKYIIPLFYNSIKIIYQHCAHDHLQPNLIQQVRNRYDKFIQQNQQKMNTLNQVHFFMIEECTQMLQSKHLKVISIRHKSQEWKTNTNSILSQEETIYLPQEIYHLDEEYKVLSIQSSQNNKEKTRKLTKQFSLDYIPEQRQKYKPIDQLWQNVQRLYQQHKIDEAYFETQKFQNSLFLYDSNYKLSQPKKKLIAKIIEEYKTMKYFYSYFDEPGYIFDKKQDGVSMHYKITQQDSNVSVRVEAQLQVSIENFLCIVAEIDLFSEYVPFAYDTKQLKKLRRNQKIGLTRVYIPLINNRQAYFVASAYDRLNTPHNSIFVFSRTITSDLKYQRQINFKVQKNQDCVELQYKFYNLEYVPLKNNRCRIRLATNIDLKLNFLPQFIICKSLRTFAFDFFKNIVQLNQKFKGSLWQTKMRQNPEFYKYFKERIRQYFIQNNNI